MVLRNRAQGASLKSDCHVLKKSCIVEEQGGYAGVRDLISTMRIGRRNAENPDMFHPGIKKEAYL